MKGTNKVVYFHINPLTNKVFYVGIGRPKRAYHKHGRSQFWKNEVNKYGYIVDIIHEGLTIEEARNLEIFYIKRFGRRDLGEGTLVNHTNGGEGFNGLLLTEETRQKMSEAGKKRKPISEETRKKMSETGKKRVFTDEHKRKISEGKKGCIGGMEGKKHSEETKKKMSEIKKRKHNEKLCDN